MGPLKVSVIIPAYNAAATIGQAIGAVLAQAYAGGVELVVVDDGSVDATAAIVRAFSQVKYVFQENQGPASARNRGAAVASGDILLFTDSDCIAESGWVQRMADGFKGASIGVVAGSYGIANPDKPLARIIQGEILFRHRHLMPDHPRAFGSYNFAIRALLFRQAGGFDVSYRRASGEDNDLSYRVLKYGVKILFLKDACVAHYHQSDLGRYLREQFRHGFWRARLYLDHVSMAGGDDYTFWKDIVEVPLALAQAGAVFWPWAFGPLAGGCFLFELAWGIRMLGFGAEGLWGGIVMWLRCFARTAGIFWGGGYFLTYQLKKYKKS